jgi:hypothetical protein
VKTLVCQPQPFYSSWTVPLNSLFSQSLLIWIHKTVLMSSRDYFKFVVTLLQVSFRTSTPPWVFWYFIRILINCCERSSYSSWGPHKTWNMT